MQLRERFLGCLYGGAIGDALGMPMEKLSISKKNKYYGEDDISDFITPHPESFARNLKRGDFTDDKLMTLAISSSLISNRKIDIRDIANSMLKCFDNKACKVYYGQTTKHGLEQYKKTNNYKTSGSDGDGCGGAIRTSPLALITSRDQSKTKYATELVCKITHKNPIAVDGANCIVMSIIHILLGNKPDSLIDFLYPIVTTENFRKKLENISIVLKNKNIIRKEVIGLIGNSEKADESVPLAIFNFLKWNNDFEKAVVEAANSLYSDGGDTDSIASMTGALTGSYLGIKSIKKRWIEEVKDSKTIRKYANKLYEISQKDVEIHDDIL